MKVIHHVIASAILSAVLYPVLGGNVIFVFLAGFLIDIDHLLAYWWEQGLDLNILRVHKKFSRNTKHFDNALYIAHTLEFLFIVAGISILFNDYAILIGLLFHVALDAMFSSNNILGKYSLIQWCKKRLPYQPVKVV